MLYILLVREKLRQKKKVMLLASNRFCYVYECESSQLSFGKILFK